MLNTSGSSVLLPITLVHPVLLVGCGPLWCPNQKFGNMLLLLGGTWAVSYTNDDCVQLIPHRGHPISPIVSLSTPRLWRFHRGIVRVMSFEHLVFTIHHGVYHPSCFTTRLDHDGSSLDHDGSSLDHDFTGSQGSQWSGDQRGLLFVRLPALEVAER